MPSSRDEPIDIEDGSLATDVQDSMSKWKQGLAVLVMLLVLAAVGIGLVALFNLIAPGNIPERRNPNFIDNIFDSALVVGAARVLLLAAAGLLLVFAVYAVASIVVRMKKGEWLKEGGPFKAHVEEAESYLEDAMAYQQAWEQTNNENEELIERLEQRDQELQNLWEQNFLLHNEVAELRKQLEEGTS